MRVWEYECLRMKYCRLDCTLIYHSVPIFCFFFVIILGVNTAD